MQDVVDEDGCQRDEQKDVQGDGAGQKLCAKGELLTQHLDGSHKGDVLFVLDGADVSDDTRDVITHEADG